MADATVTIGGEGFGATQRRDAWWIQPLVTGLVLAIFGVYSTWAAFQGENYYAEPYLSPFYSPLILVDWWPFSPAILILWMPLGFRLTCYYYRKAYYRAYFLDPPACAVGERKGRYYVGERAFPFVLQNLHRYFFYLAVIVVAFLWYDTVEAFHFKDGVGVGLGTLVLLANVVLLSFYTFSCHSFRHLIGGKLDCMSCTHRGGARAHAWKGVSAINHHHMFWAWTSLVMVGLADLYVRLVASGVIQDVRFF